MSDPSTLQDRPRVSLWRRVWLALACLVALIAILGVIGNQFDYARTTGELKAIIERLDEDDPHWRLAEIEAAREAMPEEENSARVILVVTGGLPKNWAGEDADKLLTRLVPPEQLDEQKQAALTRVMTNPSVALVVTSARRVADMPRGRFRMTHAFNPIATLLPEIQEARQTCRLLKYDALHLAQQGDIDGALRSGRAAINTARAAGDEPFFISQLVRCACLAIAVEMIERTLAQGEASERELAALQRLLELEEKHATMLIGLRGERAMHYDLFEKMVTGQLSATQVRRELAMAEPPWWERWIGWRVTRRDQINDLKRMTRFVETTKLPESEQMAAVERLERETKATKDLTLSALLAPSLTKMSEVGHRKTAAIRAMKTAVAVERFRVEQGKWPETLEQLKPKYLAEVPLDPFDGKPLRFAKLPDGVVIYTVGKDGKDDGGRVLPRPASDEGFRLWNVGDRRKPAAMRPPP